MTSTAGPQTTIAADALAASAATESTLATPGAAPGAASPVPEAVRRRLAPPMPTDRWQSWLATTVVVAIAAILRLVNLSTPRGKIFDETYYATEAQELLNHGVEWKPESNTGDFVVHPPLGKWIIAIGEKLFGYHEFGWRIMPAIFGILAVLIITRLARRLFRSTVLGCAAGLLMALDGMEFVLSRSALLDIFLMTFLLAAFACLVMDREQRRRRWLRELEAGLDPSRPGRGGRPRFAFPQSVPWWRLAAGVLTGCAMAVKWSALWYIIGFVILIYLWEVGARRSAGVRRPWRDTLLDETGWVALFGVLIVAVYLASWTGWFVSDAGWDRHWLSTQGRSEPPVIGPLINLWHYHQEALNFHTHLTTHHTYQSWPWQWLLLGRPVAFYWSGDGPCGATQCASEVLLLGTPVLWWSFLPALAALTWFGISRRDWRALAIGLGAVVGILPWFNYELSDRTMFYFYALPAEPFLILAVVYVLGAIMRPARAVNWRAGVPDRYLTGAVIAGVYLLVVAACFAYFYPIYTAKIMTYANWWARMWLGTRWV